MAVAKSYEDMQQIGEPFEAEGKMYIRVRGRCPRCGGSGHYSYNQMDGTRCYGCNGSGIKVMNVRWYSDAERARMDRAAEKRAEQRAVKQEERRIKFAARNAFGFKEAGYITLFIGDNKVINEWAHETDPCRARYNTLFGWYIPSDMEMPELPASITPIKCTWDMVRDESDPEDITMRADSEVKSIVFDLTHDGEFEAGEFVGNIGDRWNGELTVSKNITLESRFGTSHMHIMFDKDHNTFVWTTQAKDIAEGTKIVVSRAKIKDHKVYNGINQTIINYVYLAKE